MSGFCDLLAFLLGWKSSAPEALAEVSQRFTLVGTQAARFKLKGTSTEYFALEGIESDRFKLKGS